jgi:hypothetical protein
MPATLLILYAGSPLNQASTASRFPAGKATLMRFTFLANMVFYVLNKLYVSDKRSTQAKITAENQTLLFYITH